MPDHDREFWGDYREQVSFHKDRFHAVLLARSDRMKAALLCVSSRQEIPLHAPKIDLLLYVLEGEGCVNVGNESHEVRSGSILFAPAGKPRGIRATENLVVLHVASPPPTPEEHREVMEALKRLEGPS